MRKSQTVLALYFLGASMSALSAVYELPADGSTVVGTDSLRIPVMEGRHSD